jgi:hypothetical protein
LDSAWHRREDGFQSNEEFEVVGVCWLYSSMHYPQSSSGRESVLVLGAKDEWGDKSIRVI